MRLLPTVLDNPNAASIRWNTRNGAEHPQSKFSTTLDGIAGTTATLIKDNVVEEANKLKQQPGKHGGDIQIEPGPC